MRPSPPDIPTAAAGAPAAPRTVQRVRHALKLRRVEVLRLRHTSPGLLCVTFGGRDLADFVSASFDDHVKLMLPPRPGAPLALPQPGANGPVFAEGAERPLMRDYTPRRFDTAACELDIEFALHGHGTAAQWAAQASPGQAVGIGGPRGSFVIPTDFDWHLLVGDDSALPAIGRRLEELPATARAIVVVDTADASGRITLASEALVEQHWLSGNARGALAEAVRGLTLPAGVGYAWASAEASEAAAVRQVLVDTHGLDKAQIRAAAYWKRGAADHHETL